MIKKGFTLVELLAVIAVLSIISMIAFPIVSDIIDNSEKKAYEQQIKSIEKASEKWVANNSRALIEIDADDNMVKKSCYITVSTLQNQGYINVDKVINPLDDTSMSDYIVELNYHSDSQQYSYKVVNNTTLSECDAVSVAISDGTAVYFNPETNKKCNSSEATVATGTKTGCMKWYTFGGNNNSATINLILAHNTTAMVAYNSTGDNTVALEAATQLSSDTATWDSSLNPRFITVKDILKITNNKTFNVSTATDADWFYLDTNNDEFDGNSKYCWLFEYSAGSDSYGCSNADSDVLGYWTSTSALNSDPEDYYKYVWAVYDDGTLNCSYVAEAEGDGIRPVITVKKSSIY